MNGHSWCRPPREIILGALSILAVAPAAAQQDAVDWLAVEGWQATFSSSYEHSSKREMGGPVQVTLVRERASGGGVLDGRSLYEDQYVTWFGSGRASASLYHLSESLIEAGEVRVRKYSWTRAQGSAAMEGPDPELPDLEPGLELGVDLEQGTYSVAFSVNPLPARWEEGCEMSPRPSPEEELQIGGVLSMMCPPDTRSGTSDESATWGWGGTTTQPLPSSGTTLSGSTPIRTLGGGEATLSWTLTPLGSGEPPPLPEPCDGLLPPDQLDESGVRAAEARQGEVVELVGEAAAAYGDDLEPPVTFCDAPSSDDLDPPLKEYALLESQGEHEAANERWERVWGILESRRPDPTDDAGVRRQIHDYMRVGAIARMAGSDSPRPMEEVEKLAWEWGEAKLASPDLTVKEALDISATMLLVGQDRLSEDLVRRAGRLAEVEFERSLRALDPCNLSDALVRDAVGWAVRVQLLGAGRGDEYERVEKRVEWLAEHQRGEKAAECLVALR